MPNLAYLSLGSNIEPEQNLKKAVALVAASSRVLAVSPVWETPPLNRPDQPNFLNAATVVETNQNAEVFKRQVIHRIESELGRVRTDDKYAPRPIDIDIMFFNRQIFDLDNRHIPDPEVLERPFVAIPLAQIAPDYRHPETGQTLRDIAGRFKVTQADMHMQPSISQTLAGFVEN